jgi:5-methylcytosine-specific restriction protein A
MAREFAKKFYNSKQWKDVRELYIISQNGICERCKFRAGKIVHHKKYLTPTNINDPYVSLHFSNLELLCLDCHNAEHMKEYVMSKDLVFDLEGNVKKR